MARELKCFVCDIEERMPLREFFGWHKNYCLEPFGTEVDDRRHAQLMSSLHNILASQLLKKIPDLKTDDLIVSHMAEEVEKIKKWIYTDLERPWKDTQKSQEQLAAEGKRVLALWSAQFGVPIT